MLVIASLRFILVATYRRARPQMIAHDRAGTALRDDSVNGSHSLSSAAIISHAPGPQPTTTIPLTTIFIPPAPCLETRLTMLPPPGYLIWINEPVPVSNQTASSCYPNEFLRSYRSVASGVAGSSIVPPMGLLQCPANYCTEVVAESNYAACCPSGYTLAPPSKLIDSSRPAYGATCYSDFKVSSTYTVTAYDSNGNTSTAEWIASTSGAQAYAHPIDGFAASSPIIGCLVESPPEIPAKDNPTSQATITGVSIGAVSAVAIVISIVCVFLRCSRARRKGDNPLPLKIEHIQHDEARATALEALDSVICEKELTAILEMGRNSSQRMPLPEKWKADEDDNIGPFEVYGDSPHELDVVNHSVL